jgi:hypothetical protein
MMKWQNFIKVRLEPQIDISPYMVTMLGLIHPMQISKPLLFQQFIRRLDLNKSMLAQMMKFYKWCKEFSNLSEKLLLMPILIS